MDRPSSAASAATEHPPNPLWVSIPRYAREYSVGVSTVRKWEREGRLRSIRLGRTIRVDLNSGVA